MGGTDRIIQHQRKTIKCRSFHHGRNFCPPMSRTVNLPVEALPGSRRNTGQFMGATFVLRCHLQSCRLSKRFRGFSQYFGSTSEENARYSVRFRSQGVGSTGDWGGVILSM